MEPTTPPGRSGDDRPAVWVVGLVVAGLVAGLVALLTARDGRLALHVALDLWLAAGLLRLALPPAWEQVLAAAVIVAVRQFVGLALRDDGSRRPGHAHSESAPDAG